MADAKQLQKESKEEFAKRFLEYTNAIIKEVQILKKEGRGNL